MTAPRTGVVAGLWDSFRAAVLPVNAHPTQVSEMRKAFYAGAHDLLNEILRSLEHGDPDATEGDLAFMDSVHNELLAFGLSGGEPESERAGH